MNKNSIYIYLYIMYDVTSKREMGKRIAIKKLTHSLTTYPLTQKDFIYLFFFFYEGNEGLKILRGVS